MKVTDEKISQQLGIVSIYTVTRFFAIIFKTREYFYDGPGKFPLMKRISLNSN